jgi:Tfp pilus assembly protein PilO
MRKMRLQVIILIMAVIVLLNIIFAKAVLLPVYYEKEQMNKKNDQLMADIEDLKKTEYKTEEEHKRSKSQILKDMIPEEPQIPLLYEFMDTTADETGVFLRGAYFPEQEFGNDPVNTRENSIHLSISGTYSNLMVFIQKIEADPRLLIINDINISRQQDAFTSKKEIADHVSNEMTSNIDSKSPEQREESGMKSEPAYKAEMQIYYYFLPDSGPEKSLTEHKL